MIFFSLFGTAISCIFYGIIVTAAIMVLLYVVLKTISKGIVQTPIFYITGVVLAMLLTIQFSLMIGAIQAKDAADAAEIYLNQLLEDCYGTVSAQDSQHIMDAITDQFPIIGNFIDIANFSGHDVCELPEVMHSSIIDYLGVFIWHRVWWILGIIVLAVIIVMLFDRRTPVSSKPKRRSTMASRKNYDDF